MSQDDVDGASMVFLMTDGLSKILQVVPRRHKDLEAKMSTVLENLQNGEAPAGAREYFSVLKLACESNVPKIQIYALDTLEKLIAKNFKTLAEFVEYLGCTVGEQTIIWKALPVNEDGRAWRQAEAFLATSRHDSTLLTRDLLQQAVKLAEDSL